MNQKETLLPVEVAAKHLDYHPESGVFTWAQGKRFQGQIAGYLGNAQYIRIEIGGNWYSAHRLAWLLTYGEWPADQIDHINGCRTDNRICNLRAVDRCTNMQNQRKPSKNNKTGFLGVTKMCQRFRSQVRDPIKKTIYYLGTFDTPEEAHAAYVAKKRELHPGCTI